MRRTGVTAVRTVPVTGPGAWRREDLERDRSWIHHLDADCLAEIDAAIGILRERDATLATTRAKELPLKQLRAFLHEVLWQDVAGRGIGLIRGLPRERYSEQELGMLFWAIGQCMGTGVSQNAQGDRLGHVRSRELDYDALNVRGYQTSHALEFHCDPSDVVGLLCLRQAPEGGASSVVSGLSIFNVLLEEHPEVLPRLYRGFVYDRRGEEAFYQAPVSEPVPVFAEVDGELSIRYVRKSIETGMAKLGYAFGSEDEEALAQFDAASRRQDLVVSMHLEPGDMQFVNNYVVLHSRSGYTDHPEPTLRRHLLRLWLKVDGLRALDDTFIEFDAASGWSRREGIRPPDAPMPRDESTPLLG